VPGSLTGIVGKREIWRSLETDSPTHFTRANNLPDIIKHGIYPISRIAEIGVTPEINDELRLDGRLDGISLSIAFPNSRMFYKYRQENQPEALLV